MDEPRRSPTTYEACIEQCASTIADGFYINPHEALSAYSFALSLAFGKTVAEVFNDFNTELDK
jgi:hypothetical protein